MKTVGAVVVTVLCLAFGSVPAAAHPVGAEAHPDLQTLKPAEMRITQTCGFLFFSCKRYMRFSNTVINLGNGRMELRPENNSSTAKTKAYQRIYSHDAAGTPYFVREQRVGEFTFHPAHSHWHFEGFANYSLVTSTATATTVTGITKRNSQKTTFCLIDTTRVNTTIEHASGQTYTRCGQNDMTGISVGWGDRYGWELAGQEFDLNGVADGYYWIVSTADFRQRLTETDETNNCSAAKVEIRGTAVYDRGQKIPC